MCCRTRCSTGHPEPAGGGAGVSYGSSNRLQEGQRSEVRPSRNSETKTVFSSRSSEKEIKKKCVHKVEGANIKLNRKAGAFLCSKKENVNIKANSPQLTTSRWRSWMLRCGGGSGKQWAARKGWRRKDRNRQNLVHSNCPSVARLRLIETANVA